MLRLFGRGRIMSAMLAGLLVAAPAATALAEEVTVLNIGGVPVSVTRIGTHNTSSISPRNGDTVKLQDGSRGEIWGFEGQAGQCVDINLTSPDFDPYLVLRFGEPFGEQVATDDDSGMGDSAHLHGRLPSTGDYYLMVTSSGAGEDDGKYTLDLGGC